MTGDTLQKEKKKKRTEHNIKVLFCSPFAVFKENPRDKNTEFYSILKTKLVTFLTNDVFQCPTLYRDVETASFCGGDVTYAFQAYFGSWVIHSALPRPSRLFLLF